MFQVMNTKEIEAQIEQLQNDGMVENIDFKIFYFNNQAELKMINR